MEPPSQKDFFKKRNIRATRARKKIIALFNEATSPLSPMNVLHLLHTARIPVHKTTVYREIRFLEKVGVVKRVYIAHSTGLYERANKPHHHHAVCNSCGTIEELTVPEEKTLINAVKIESSFTIDDHSLEFYGECSSCQ